MHILASSSTRIAGSRSFLDFFGGKELNRFFNLNETIAYGTAELAAILSEDRS